MQPLAAGRPYAFVDNKLYQHVIYRGSDGHIHELQRTSEWEYSDISTRAYSPPPGG